VVDCVSHMWTMTEYAWGEPWVESAEVLERTAREGALADVWVVGGLESELEYGNHRSAAKYGEEVLRKAVTDMPLGRIIVFPVTHSRVLAVGSKRREIASNPRLDVRWRVTIREVGL